MTSRARRPLLARLVAAACLLGAPAIASAFTDEFAAPLGPLWAMPTYGLPGGAVSPETPDGDALDGRTLELIYPGDTSTDDFGPGAGSEISTAAEHHYGIYEGRLRTPKISRMAGVVASFFTYFNDGKDHDGDKIIDNHEIDIEFLANEPNVIYMSVWTEYQAGDTETFYKTTRKVNLRTGQVWQTPAGGEGGYDLEEIAPLDWRYKRFKHSRRFSTYRFDWQKGSVTYSIDLEDGQGFRTLWTLTGAPGVSIPSIPSPLRMNLWHNRYHWNGGQAARVPGRDISYRADRVVFP